VACGYLVERNIGDCSQSYPFFHPPLLFLIRFEFVVHSRDYMKPTKTQIVNAIGLANGSISTQSAVSFTLT
jgi:hypothetical protein